MTFDIDSKALIDAYERYSGSQHPTRFDDLIASVRPQWLRQCIEFAEFLSFLHANNSEPVLSHLFLSSPHGGATLFQRNLEAHLGEEHRAAVRLLQVDQEPIGTEFPLVIKTRIWLSDGLVAAIPREWTMQIPVAEQDSGWVPREIEHAQLLLKYITLFVETGANRQGVRQRFGRHLPFLSSEDSRHPTPERLDRLQRALDSSVHGGFGEDADDVRAQLDVIISKIRKLHGSNMIIGFLRQFEDPQTLARILSLTHTARTRKEICAHLCFQTMQQYKRDSDKLLVTLKEEHSQEVKLLNQRIGQNRIEFRKALAAVNQKYDVQRHKVEKALKQREEKVSQDMERRFENVWRHVKQRKLNLGDGPYELLHIPPSNTAKYVSRLPAILRRLQPSLNPEAQRKWHEELVSNIIRLSIEHTSLIC